LKFTIGNSLNYTFIRHPALKGVTLHGMTTPLGRLYFERLAGYSVSQLDSTEHAINPLTRDALSGPHNLGSNQNVLILPCTGWMTYGAFGSQEDYCKSNLKPL